MKIDQIVDKEVDQNEIESQFLWYLSESMMKINLLALETSSLGQIPYNIPPILIKSIPNNQYCGIMVEMFGENLKCLFISDENFTNIKKLHHYVNYAMMIFCFYDDSIFIFENGTDAGNTSGYYRAKRYIISQNKWVLLKTSPLKNAISCTGFNQKIFISSNENYIVKLCVYDINLDSYSFCGPDINYRTLLITVKNLGKIYLFRLSDFCEIFTCETPLSDWTFIYSSSVCMWPWIHTSHAYHNGSIYYYLSGKGLYQFNLSNFKLNLIKA